MANDGEPQLPPAAALSRKLNTSNGEESDYETHRRFDRMARLIGEPALETGDGRRPARGLDM